MNTTRTRAIKCMTMLLSLLSLAPVAYAQQGYQVSVMQDQGGIPASAYPKNPYASLEAAEAAAEAFIGWFIPMPTLQYPNSVSPPVSRQIRLAATHRRSTGRVQYEYHADLFGYQFENRSAINCSGTPSKESLGELLSFMPSYSIDEQTMPCVFSVELAGGSTQNHWSLKRWPVNVTYAGNNPPSTTLDSIKARSVAVLIDPLFDPKCTGCECETTASDFSCNVGNPISPSISAKYASSADINLPDLSFSVQYASNRPAAKLNMLGDRWGSSYFSRIEQETWSPGNNAGYVTSANVYRGSGAIIGFQLTSGQWVPSSDVNSRLTELRDVGGNRVGWSYFESTTGNAELYDVSGRLLSIRKRSGAIQNLSYNSSGQLSSVTNSFGRALNFTYHPPTATANANKLAAVTDPAGNAVSYGYDAQGSLTSVTYPDGSIKTYHYNEPSYTNATNLPNALTGITDESGERFATYYYDSAGRAVSTEHAGGVEKYSFNYASPYAQTTVTDPFNVQRTYSFKTVLGLVKPTGISSPCPGCGNSNFQSITYDGNGNVASRTDFGGSRTASQYDLATNLETQRIEAFGASLQRTTDTIWDANLRLPMHRSVKGANNSIESLTKWAYNARGQVLTTSKIDPATAVARTFTTTYCEQSDITTGACPLLGLVTSTDGPRTDTNDTTTYIYYPNDDTSCATAPTACPYRKGDLWKVTNALGQVAETLKYDGAGRVLTVKDPNGVITDMEYQPRGWLTARKVRGTDDGSEADDAITRIEYEPTGLVSKVIQPDGAFTAYDYDAAHRLISIADNSGNRIVYTLDNAGNRIKEDTKDGGSALQRTLSRVYNQLGQLQTAADAYDNPTDFAYDANGNTDTATDALGRVTDNDYDPLNRLKRTLQDVAGIRAETKFQYDALDNLTQVTDPKGLNTQYQYNGLGDLLQLDSPDTGVSLYTYDSAGNRKTSTDARGEPATYTYDALNRLTGIGYSDPALNVTYTYDASQAVCEAGETFAIGRLTRLDDGSGSTQYCYDRRGNLVRKVQTTNGQVFAVRYAYTKAGRIASVTYPSGTRVDYAHNALGQPSAVSVTRAGGATEALLSNVTHHPFGPVAEIEYGNGRRLKRTLNQNYQPDTIEDTAADGLSLGFGFDAVGNLTALRTPAQSGAPIETFEYDTLSRLTDVRDGPTGVAIEQYAYDPTGNRMSVTTAAGAAAYQYPAESHRLAAVGAESRAYDAAGNTKAIGDAREFVYSAAGRMSQVKQSGNVAMNYAYNGKGEQVRRYPAAASTAQTYAFYDEAGRVLGSYDSTGTRIQEVIWLADLPVGVIASDKLHYVQADHLGTPRNIIDPTRAKAVWKWDLAGEAFGKTVPNQDPDGDAATFNFDLRFPGQRYDAASGLNYNYFRDYDAGTGRYVESDPIGLKGGITTYSYAGLSPLRQIDPKGLLSYGPSCNAAQRARINSEIVQLANELKEKAGSKECNKGDCDWGLVRDVMSFIANEAVFSCNLGWPCGDATGMDTLVFLYGPQVSAPSAAEINAPGQCGCLRSVLFHEAAHKVRYEIEDDDVIRRETLKCVSCATTRTENGGIL